MFDKNKNKPKKSAFIVYLFWGSAFLAFVLLCGVLLLVSQSPEPQLVTERIDGKISVNSELQFDFKWPVSRQLSLTMTPQVYGEVRYENMIISQHLARRVFFKPELTWMPGTTYTIKITNVKSALLSYRQPKEYIFVFTVEDDPGVSAVTPGQTDTIGPDATWNVTLDRPNTGLVDYQFTIDPVTDVEVIPSQDKKTYQLKPRAPLSQGQAYTLHIIKKTVRYLFGTSTLAFQGEPTDIWQGKWQIQEAPGISRFDPVGSGVALTSPLVVVFDKNVNFGSFKEYATIEPAVAGEWQTIDYRTLTFKPSTSYALDTTYIVTFKTGLQTSDGSYLTEDAIHRFSTIGPADVVRITPANQSMGVSVASSIHLTFDQAVDHVSAQNNFSLTPKADGTFSWDGQTMTFTPAPPLVFNTSYTVTEAAGVKSPGGYDSVAAQTVTFATELSVTRLAVPFHRQEHNLSCEVATLVMALNYRGLSVSEQTLIDAIGFDPTKKQNGVWGNPNVAFVGDIDGHQPSTGYGVYWGPIAAAAQKYRTARVITGGKLTDITNEIKKGNPVIFWGTAGSGRRIDWKTPQGGTVVAVSGEHTRVVIGFIGPADSPTKIITLDPLFGEKYFTPSAFLANWSVLGSNGVVVE